MAIPEKPITREETYYAVMAGQAVKLPDYPITRQEAYLDYIARNGGGDSVSVEQIKKTGEKIATITVNGEAVDIYASAGGSGGGAVDTVNGKTGDVILTASDVGALPDNTHIPADQIQSDYEQSDNTKKDYIKNKPTLGTAAAKNVPASGNAGNNEVVLGNDSRLSDARNAADVSSWAKKPNKPTYTASEVGAIPSTDKGANGGVATLGNDGKVPSSQLPSMSGGHSIKDNGTEMADESALNFTDFDISDDGTNNETDIKAHRLTSAELLEICSPLPGVMSDMPVLFDEREIEYQVGWCVLDNGTKKPVYEKTLTGNTLSSAGWKAYDTGIGAGVIDKVLSFSGAMYSSSGWNVSIGSGEANNELKFEVKPATGVWEVYTGNITSHNDVPCMVKILYTKTTDTPV